MTEPVGQITETTRHMTEAVGQITETARHMTEAVGQITETTRRFDLPTFILSSFKLKLFSKCDVRRWQGKTCGAFVFSLIFLCYFLCIKTKKVKNNV